MEKRIQIAEAKMAEMASQKETAEAKMAKQIEIVKGNMTKQIEVVKTKMAAKIEIAEAKIKRAVGDAYHRNQVHRFVLDFRCCMLVLVSCCARFKHKFRKGTHIY